MNERDFNRAVFKNYTENFPSMRLTPEGWLILSKVYETWCFPLNENDKQELQKGAMILGLHRHLKMPYYWDNKQFCVFGNEYALEIEMVNRDLSHWCKSFL